MLVTAILAALHVISAVAWLGGGILFGFVIAPRIPKLGPLAARQFLTAIGPTIARFFQFVAISTVVFGVLLLYDMYATQQVTVDYGNPQWVSLVIGMSAAIVGFVWSEVAAVPALNKLIAVHEKIPVDGSSIPPELPKAAQRAGMTALLALVFIVVAFSFMIGAGFY